MLSRFDIIPERDRQTDGRTDRQTDGQTGRPMDRIAASILHVSITVLTRDENIPLPTEREYVAIPVVSVWQVMPAVSRL